nr:uncharacterized protein LOC116777793 [Danaus plexippus plexippus]
MPRQIEARRVELRQVLMAVWQTRLAQPTAGHAAVASVRSVLEEWLNRSHGALSFRLTQVLTGHGCFGKYLCRIGREQTSQCHHCGDGRNDTALHTLAECPAWAEQRRDLVAAIGDAGNLSLPTVVSAMVGSESGWCAVATFCEAVMLAKEAAEREREAAFLTYGYMRNTGWFLFSKSLTVPFALPRERRGSMRIFQPDTKKKKNLHAPAQVTCTEGTNNIVNEILYP